MNTFLVMGFMSTLSSDQVIKLRMSMKKKGQIFGLHNGGYRVNRFN